jgi:3-phenylpropionate/cinnamic acid dioxygenase small subunit
MTERDLQRLSKAELHGELDLLTAAYVHALDDGEIDRWPDFFTEDCLYRVLPRENYDNDLPLAVWYCRGRGMLRDRIKAIHETQLFEPRALRHVTGNALIQACADDVVQVVTNYVVYESMADKPTTVFNVGRYIDRVVVDADGELRFAEKLCVFDTAVIPTSLIYPI